MTLTEQWREIAAKIINGTLPTGEVVPVKVVDPDAVTITLAGERRPAGVILMLDGNGNLVEFREGSNANG